MFFDCIHKKELILVIFYLFLVFFWAPTVQPGAPFLFKACILAYNNIFLIKVTKNWMYLYCIPKKQLILVAFQLFSVVFWAPTGQPEAPFLFKACILAYNNIFIIKVPRIGCYFTVYPKNSSFLLFFSYFWQFFGPLQAPTGQPGAPFIFKACILAYNNIFFIKVPENWMFLDCVPKKQVILVVFWLFLAVFFVTIWSVDFFWPKTSLVA